jgi:23S rRNA pseudouridine955/2504/2580 synthase
MNDLARLSENDTRSRADLAESSNRPAVQWLTIDSEQAGQRIDNFLLRICKGVPKSHVYQVLRSGQVRVNKGRIDATYRLVEGDMVRVPPMRMAEREHTHVPAMEFAILFEDEHLLIP